MLCMLCLFGGVLVFVVSHSHASIPWRSYVQPSVATTGSAITQWVMGHLNRDSAWSPVDAPPPRLSAWSAGWLGCCGTRVKSR